jgi:hypothetical protein
VSFTLGLNVTALNKETLRDLHLNLKGEYFLAIQAGKKQYEYRLATEKFLDKLSKNTYGSVVIKYGYPSNERTDRILMRDWRGFHLISLLHPHFGSQPVEVCAIPLIEAAYPTPLDAHLKIGDHEGSSNYLRLAELTRGQNVVCRIDSNPENPLRPAVPERLLAQASYLQNGDIGLYRIGTHETDYIHAYSELDFMRLCMHRNVTFIESSSI